jgi:PIN domain nuclease of toxin-antitoxin system
MKKLEPLLLDTHAWLWLIEDNPRLHATARRAIAKASAAALLRLSATSVFEVALLMRKKRYLAAGMTLEDWMCKAIAIPGLTVLPIDARVALKSQMIGDDFHSDPADRFIVATAQMEHARLATADALILEFATRTELPVLNLG